MKQVVLERFKMVSFFCSLASVIFVVASCAGNEWYKIGKSSFGLWNDSSQDSWLNCCRAFVVIACIASLFGMVLLMISKTFASANVSMMASVCMFIGMGVYTDKTFAVRDLSYTWSFYAGWIASITLFMTALNAALGVKNLAEKLLGRSHYIVLGVSPVILLLVSLAIFSNNWLVHPGYNSGLWMECVNGMSCHSIRRFERDPVTGDIYEYIPVWLIVTRAFAVVSFAWVIGALKMSLLSLKFARVKKFIGPVFLLGAGLCLLVSASCYTHYKGKHMKKSRGGIKFSWSYMITWISVFVSFATGIIGLVGHFVPVRDYMSDENDPVFQSFTDEA